MKRKLWMLFLAFPLLLYVLPIAIFFLVFTVLATADQGPGVNPYLFWPVPERYEISSFFGTRDDPFGTGESEFHGGIDIPGDVGDTVQAAAAGRVEEVGFEPRGLGNFVKLSHAFEGQGFSTVYGHLDQVLVKVGDLVGQGDRVGKLGDSGRSTGPHTDFRVKAGDEPLDPFGLVFTYSIFAQKLMTKKDQVLSSLMEEVSQVADNVFVDINDRWVGVAFKEIDEEKGLFTFSLRAFVDRTYYKINKNGERVDVGSGTVSKEVTFTLNVEGEFVN